MICALHYWEGRGNYGISKRSDRTGKKSSLQRSGRNASDQQSRSGDRKTTADNDCLKAEGQKYAKMLRDAGVGVDDMVTAGMPHGFYESGFGKISVEEMDFLGDDVKEMIRNGKIAQTSQECLEYIKEHF